jgi:ATP/maltotriose-dependent transcriptional regulator MalT
MAEQRIPDVHDEEAAPFWGSRAAVQLESSIEISDPVDLLDGGGSSPLWWKRSPEEVAPDTLGRWRTRQNLTGASLPQIRRGLAQAWRLVLGSQIDEALEAIERLELQFDDVPPATARRFRRATQLLRAAGLAFEDDSLGALAITRSHLKENGTTQHCHVASTICRIGLWRLGEFDCFHSLPRLQPRMRWSKSWAVSAMLDMSIEAAVALDRLHLSTARRLASDALQVAKAVPKEAAGLAALPARVVAQVFYGEGCLDQADQILRDQLPVINAKGPIDAALRAYLILTRIAKHRMQYDFAALLLREAEALGERRRWPRLVAACLAERTLLLLQRGQTQKARLVLEYLDRYAEARRKGSGHSASEVNRYRALSHWRVSWAEPPSAEAVVGLRQLYHQAIEKGDFYAGCALAVDLVETLVAIGESEEADALLSHTIRTAAVAGLYQVFLEGGPGSGELLRRAYARAAATDRDVLPFVEACFRNGVPVAQAAPLRSPAAASAIR